MPRRIVTGRDARMGFPNGSDGFLGYLGFVEGR
jgi:hypothetical protein